MSKNKFSIWNILIVLIIIVLVIIFVMSLGQVSSEKISKPNEFREDREKAKQKHKWYKSILRNQKKLKSQLDKKFKLVHFGIRVSLFLLWGGVIAALYLIGLIASLGGVFACTAGISGFIIAVNYLSTGTYCDVRELAEIIKIRTENWVYSKYLDLDERIESNKLVISDLEDSHLQ